MHYEPDTEKEDIARVEEILSAAAARHPEPAGPTLGKPAATHALWLCACISDEDWPTWLIYRTPGDAVRWRRIKKNAFDVRDLVDVHSYAGGHVSPWDVREWLETGDEDGSIAGDVFGDETVLPALTQAIRGW